MRRHWYVIACLVVLSTTHLNAREMIRLPNNPALSPDGKTLVFDWNGDLWRVEGTGGRATPLTQHPGQDSKPIFSPDGKQIAFVSDRDGSAQVYVMPADGGGANQLTFHTAGFDLHQWTPDGKQLLVGSQRDNFWRHAERFFLISAENRGSEIMLFDAYGESGAISPDGKRLLFTREGPAWWRKGYRGSQASQIWMFDREDGQFTRLLDHEAGNRWPLWKPDGTGFYYVGGKSGSFNLWEHSFQDGRGKQLTHFEDDSVVFPCISADGSTVVFRHLFDFYRIGIREPGSPRKIEIWHDVDRSHEHIIRRVLTSASEVAFSGDGLEIAFIAGGDLWVMDTELREPRQITSTPEEERSPVFSPDGGSILFASDMGEGCDIYRATRADKQQFWWLNHSFKIDRLTNDGVQKDGISWSPDGKHVGYIGGRGDLWVMKPDGKEPTRILEGVMRPEYDWSPDGKWVVYSTEDQDFNRDIWLAPLDRSRPPFNLSRHPRADRHPVWSPDGKLIAFTGQRGTDVDIHYVWLRAEDDEADSRARKLQQAIEKINKARVTGPRKPDSAEPQREGEPGKKSVGQIDFDRIHDRIHRVTISNSTEGDLFWAPDSKRLAFTATVDGRRGTYTIEIPTRLTPTLLTTQVGSQARWLTKGNQIVWLSGGLPASFRVGAANSATSPSSTTSASPSPIRRGGSSSSEASTGGGYRFDALQTVDVGKKHVAVFDQCWRVMRDNWYDEKLNNRDWEQIREKYRETAAQSPDTRGLATVVSLMLGELNGSHLGFSMTGSRSSSGQGPGERTWRETTAHLGVRFDPQHQGPGLKVRDVIWRGPADQKRRKIEPGELILTIDGKEVSRGTDLTTILNGPLSREIALKVRGVDGKDRDVAIRPTTFPAARGLLYEQWVRDNRKLVEKLSGGKLGYLHIQAMAMPSFHRFEEELYSVGYGKDGLVIDVRENGGGSTTDHLLTALTQPVHAITVPRGGTPGYPNDRKVYATWNKPIVVMCNQNSFSNAEIFSHAIKTLRRGQLVGVPSAGGVISTGGVSIMDVGYLRMPFRGWYVLGTGQDMELNGAIPDHILWPSPGELPAGKDVQLEKAVSVLLTDVQKWREQPRVPLIKASERK